MQKPSIQVLAVLFAGLVLISSETSSAGEVGLGKRIYENKCQMCHGANGKGDGPAAAAFNPKPQDLTDSAFWRQKNVDTLVTNTVEHGHGLMPPIDLKPAEVKAVIDHISSAFKPRSP
jgi:mono/diheme cytochrome c family protein